jgi:hypothetical protein
MIGGQRFVDGRTLPQPGVVVIKDGAVVGVLSYQRHRRTTAAW